jgi:hypothetical protein
MPGTKTLVLVNTSVLVRMYHDWQKTEETVKQLEVDGKRKKMKNSILTQFPAKMANSYLVQQHFSLMASRQLTDYIE